MTDPLTGLSALRSTEPSPQRAARIHQRCQAELARRTQRSTARPTRPVRLGKSPLWPMAVASLSVAYVAEVIVLAVEMLGAR